jgi:hypothetical protein
VTVAIVARFLRAMALKTVELRRNIFLKETIVTSFGDV